MGLTNLQVPQSDPSRRCRVGPYGTGDVGVDDPEHCAGPSGGGSLGDKDLVGSGEVDGVVKRNDDSRTKVNCRCSI